MITLNSWGVSADAIGKIGLSLEERKGLADSLTKGLEAIREARKCKSIGFMDLPEYPVEKLIQWAEKKREGITDVIIDGIGGSSLGARAILATHKSADDFPTIHFTENMDPDSFVALFNKVNWNSTLVVVISKSGTTIETMSKFAILWSKLQEVHGAKAGSYVVAITDPEKGSLRGMVDTHGFETFEVPDNVGGRFSVYTPVGFVPLALAGYPIQEMLKGAADARDKGLNSGATFTVEGSTVNFDNAVVQAAADHFLLYKKGIKQTILFTYSDALYPLTDWFCQLWGESLGKALTREGETVNFGMTPVKALGVIDQHSQLQLYVEGPVDKHIVFLEVEKFASEVIVPPIDGFPESLSHLVGKDLGVIMRAELEGTQRALEQGGRPTSRLKMSTISPQSVGGFILFWELVTALIGELAGVNAFDQPGVELGKKISHGLLGRAGFESYAEETHSGSVLSTVQSDR